MKKPAIIIGIVVAGLVLLAWFGSLEAPVALIFGWIPFLADVGPRMTVDGPGLVLGVIAVVLFVASTHAIARAWRRQSSIEPGNSPWKWRWSATLIAAVFLLFTAGITLVGTAHQIVWLAFSDRPLVVPGRPFDLGSKVQSENNLKQMILSFHNFHDSYKKFPGYVQGPNDSLRTGWETDILITMFTYYLPEGVDRKKPWNDPVNDKYFKCIIPEFLNPGLVAAPVANEEGYGLNHYSANVHVLGPDRTVNSLPMPDGTSNTIVFGEIVSHFPPWPKPGNWRDPSIGINRYPNGFGGPGATGAQFAMADGSVRFISDRVSPQVLRALSTPAGGEKIAESDWEP